MPERHPTDRNLVKIPNVGDVVMSRHGDVEVLRVSDDGVVIEARPVNGGRVRDRRAHADWWTIIRRKA